MIHNTYIIYCIYYICIIKYNIYKYLLTCIQCILFFAKYINKNNMFCITPERFTFVL